MKRSALISLLVCVAARSAMCAASPVDDLLKEAQTAFTAGKYDDAVGLYEKIFTEHPEASDRWFTTEKSIATTLAKKGDLAGAAQAAHICLDAASSIQQFDEAAMLVAGIMSATDGKVDRANQFLAFAQTGPVDGAANPMEATGYPSLPAREAAFATIRQQAGDNAAAARLRAFTYLFSGKPRDALAQFADAFRKSSTVTDLQRSVPDLVLVGLRAVRGTKAGLDTAVRFVSFGPDGPDAKPKTADDIADPFAQFLPNPPAPDEGGLAGLGAEDLAALKKMRDAAKLYAGDIYLQAAQRRVAFGVLERTNDALDAWSAAEKKWYIEISNRSERFLDWPTVYMCIQTAARDRALHFGGTRAFWAGIDAEKPEDKGAESAKGMATARKAFDGVCAMLDKIAVLKSVLNPLKKPAAY